LLFVAGKTFQILGDIASLDFGAAKDDFKDFGTHDYAINGKDAPYKAPVQDYVHKLPPPTTKDIFGFQPFLPLGPTIPASPTTPIADPKADPKADQSVLDILAAADAKDKKKKTAKSIHDVAGGGNQVRNVVVNIGKQIETVRIETTNMAGQSVSQIKKILEDLLVTAVRDSELALGH
jgi:hypothetical protein